MIQAGQLDKRVVIQRHTGVQTPAGNEDPASWVDLATQWMGFVPKAGRERMSQIGEIGITMETIRLRWFTGLTQKDRLKYFDPLTQTDRFFNIEDIQAFPHEREQVLLVSEVH